MISFCEKIIQFAREEVNDDPVISEMQVLSLLRLFETLGEASSKVSDAMKAAHPEIPWVEASDTRNRLIHGYDDLDMSILWHAAEHNIPSMLEQLVALKANLDAEL